MAKIICNDLELAVVNGSQEEVEDILRIMVCPRVFGRIEWKENGVMHYTKSLVIVNILLKNNVEAAIHDVYRLKPLCASIRQARVLAIIQRLTVLTQQPIKEDHDLRKFEEMKLKELLKVGANTNIKSQENPLFENANIVSCLDYTPLALKASKLFIKRILFNTFSEYSIRGVNLKPYNETDDHYKQLFKYQENCICELVQMNRYIIYHDQSLLQIMMHHHRRYDMFVPNFNLVSIDLATSDFGKDYPIYSNVISQRLKVFFNRNQLLEKLQTINIFVQVELNNVFVNRKTLDYDTAYGVAEYLSNDDLCNLIIAFDNC